MPFLDSLTSGYLLKIPQDLKITHNIINEETNKLDGFYRAGDLDDQILYAKSINLGKQNSRYSSNCTIRRLSLRRKK
jgi:hypothetical protein